MIGLVMKKIGLFGGSFDPIHEGHLTVAQAAMQQVSLDEIYWIPSAYSPLKDKAPMASDQDRLAMLQMVLRYQKDNYLLDWELKRPSPSYSIDTVLQAEASWPRAQLYWIMGEDQWRLLPQWRQGDLLAKKVIFLVYRREGTESEALNFSFPGVRYQLLKGVEVPFSSTQVREKRAKSENWQMGLPEEVAQYIQEHHLYI